MRIWKLLGVVGIGATGMMAGRDDRDDRGRLAPAPGDTWSSMTLNVDPDLCAGPRATPFPRETTGRRRSGSTARR